MSKPRLLSQRIADKRKSKGKPATHAPVAPIPEPVESLPRPPRKERLLRVRVTEEAHARITEEARINNADVSSIVRLALEAYRGNKNRVTALAKIASLIALAHRMKDDALAFDLEEIHEMLTGEEWKR